MVATLVATSYEIQCTTQSHLETKNQKNPVNQGLIAQPAHFRTGQKRKSTALIILCSTVRVRVGPPDNQRPTLQNVGLFLFGSSAG